MLKPYPHVRIVRKVYTIPDEGTGYKMEGVTIYYLEGIEGYVEFDEFLTKEQIDALFEYPVT
jgi:hypothetical protein